VAITLVVHAIVALVAVIAVAVTALTTAAVAAGRVPGRPAGAPSARKPLFSGAASVEQTSPMQLSPTGYLRSVPILGSEG
jgi:hypothetical protein